MIILTFIFFFFFFFFVFFQILNNAAKVKYKLIYFDARGRAEVTRMILAAADVKYEDQRIKFEDWPKLKPS